ncbi:MAG: MopE-related protein [archaeon]
MRKLLALLLLLALLPAALATTINVTSFTYTFNATQAFSTSETVLVTSQANDTITLAFDEWLTGDDLLNFSNETGLTLQISVDVPAQPTAGNWTKAATLLIRHQDNTTENLSLTFTCIAVFPDLDGDGFTADIDCNDTNPEVRPNATELIFNGIDDDCNAETLDNPEFSVETDKHDYSIGEEASMRITAPEQTSVSITICPQGNGWVSCYGPYLYTGSFPRIEPMHTTNKTGTYILEATLRYFNGTHNRTRTYNTSYLVSNSLQIEVAGDRTIRENQQTNLTAAAAGGISPYTYTWKLSTGTIRNDRSVNVSYDTEGTYAQIITVTDAAGNTLNETVNVVVRKYVNITIQVKDKDTASPLNLATVKLDDEEEITDDDGRAVFEVRKGTYYLRVTAEDYATFTQDILFNTSQTFTVNLTVLDTTDPSIDPLTPANQNFKDTVVLRFRAYDTSPLNCTLYLGNRSDSWLARQQSIANITTSIERSFTLTLPPGQYFWRVDCIDARNNQGSMQTSSFIVDANEEQLIGEPVPNDSMSRLEQAIEQLDSLNLDSRQAAEALQLKDVIDTAITQIQRNLRDINTLDYRRDLTSDEKEQQKELLRQSTLNITTQTPISIDITRVDRYVKYVKDEELQAFLDDYATVQGTIDNALFFSATKNIQDFITVSTTVYVGEVTLMDNSRQPITVIEKTLTYKNASDSWLIFEYLPKNVAASVQALSITQEHVVIKEDPILQFGQVDKIVYSINEQLDSEQAMTINTILFNPKPTRFTQKVTAFSILGVAAGSFDIKTALIILIVLLLCTYGFYAIEGGEKVKAVYYYVFKDKKLQYLKVLINDVYDYLGESDDIRAGLVYREIRLAYEQLSQHSKQIIYEEGKTVGGKLNARYAEELMERVQHLRSIHNSRAGEEQQKLQEALNMLDEEDRKKLEKQREEMKA